MSATWLFLPTFYLVMLQLKCIFLKNLQWGQEAFCYSPLLLHIIILRRSMRFGVSHIWVRIPFQDIIILDVEKDNFLKSTLCSAVECGEYLYWEHFMWTWCCDGHESLFLSRSAAEIPIFMFSVGLEQWLPMRGTLPSRIQRVMPGYVLGSRLDMGVLDCTCGIQGVEARDAATRPILPRMASPSPQDRHIQPQTLAVMSWMNPG